MLNLDKALFTYRAQIVEAKCTPHGVERDQLLAGASAQRELLVALGVSEKQIKQAEKEAYAIAQDC